MLHATPAAHAYLAELSDDAVVEFESIASPNEVTAD
jgi:hypothetical protein